MQTQSCSTEPVSKSQFCDTAPGRAPDTGPMGPGPQLWISGVGTKIAGAFPTIQTAAQAEHLLSAAPSWRLPSAPMRDASWLCQLFFLLSAHLNDCTIAGHYRLQHRVLLQLKRRFSSSLLEILQKSYQKYALRYGPYQWTLGFLVKREKEKSNFPDFSVQLFILCIV